MKRFFSTVAAGALALLALTAPAAGQGSGLAYIDTDEILAGIPEAAQAMQSLQADVRVYEQRADSLGREFQQMQQAFNNLPVTTTEQARQQEAQRLQQTFQQFQQQLQPLQQRAQQREQQLQLLIRPYLAQLGEVVEQVRRERNLAMIFNAGSSGLIAADTTLNLSDAVRERLVAAVRQQGGQ